MPFNRAMEQLAVFIVTLMIASAACDPLLLLLDNSTLTNSSFNHNRSTCAAERRHSRPTLTKERFWRFYSTSDPSLYDAFARGRTLYAVLQVKRPPCGRCRLENRRILLLDYRGKYAKEPSWTCHFVGRQATNGTAMVDPDGNVVVVKCAIPREVVATGGDQTMDLIASAAGEEPLLYLGVEFCAHVFRTRLGPKKKKKTLVGCTMVRPSLVSASELLEWVAYHVVLQGFEQFLIYSDGESSGLRSALRGPIANGTVEVVDWEWPTWQDFMHQQAEMHSCLYRYRGAAEWVAFFDVDEYLQPLSQEPTTVAETVRRLLPVNSSEAAGILVRSVFFEPSATPLITQKALRREASALPADSRTKCIVRPDAVSIMTIHTVKVAEDGVLQNHIVADPERELRINHYRGRRSLSEPTVARDESMLRYGPALTAAVCRLGGGGELQSLCGPS